MNQSAKRKKIPNDHSNALEETTIQTYKDPRMHQFPSKSEYHHVDEVSNTSTKVASVVEEIHQVEDERSTDSGKFSSEKSLIDKTSDVVNKRKPER